MFGGEFKMLKKDQTGTLMDRIKALTKQDVLVGIPQENSSRPGQEVNNAELLFIHTNGSPVRSIPARPVLEPAITAKGNKEPIAGELGQAMKAILQNQPGPAKQHMKLAGMTAQNAARTWFTDPRNGWAPNSPLTVLRKLDKLRGAKAAKAMEAFEAGEATFIFKDQEYGVNTPLIDTGEMRKAITWLIREKG